MGGIGALGKTAISLGRELLGLEIRSNIKIAELAGRAGVTLDTLETAPLEDLSAILDRAARQRLIDPRFANSINIQIAKDAQEAVPASTIGAVPDGQLKIGDTNMIYSIDENNIAEIQSIRTPISKRGQGSARNALNELLSIFKSSGVNTVKLISSPLDKKTSDNKLFNFYKDMGFEDTGETANMAGDKVMKLNLNPLPKGVE
tara:strand:- start:28 stop:636 length:609 start_codon:yes stop_codon:yes gene_type:complete